VRCVSDARFGSNCFFDLRLRLILSRVDFLAELDRVGEVNLRADTVRVEQRVVQFLIWVRIVRPRKLPLPRDVKLSLRGGSGALSSLYSLLDWNLAVRRGGI
jgi:hypothetical protein